MKTITNTAKKEIHPEWTMGGNPEAIEAQEARGQQELVNADVVPTQFYQSKKEDFEALGFIFGEVVTGDPLFQYVTLPPGWKKQATDHSMWVNICDETGKERVSIFYKAAFYDRCAMMEVLK